MALIQNGEIWEVRHFCIAGDQIGVNVLHYASSVSGIANLEASAMLAEIAVACGPLYRALITTNAQYYGASMSRRHPLPPHVPVTTLSGAGAGSVVGDMLPRQTAGMLKKFTAFAGRAYRGRVYVPFPGEADCDSFGSPTADHQTRMTQLGNGLDGPFAITLGGVETKFTSCLWNKNSPAEAPAITVIKPGGGWGAMRKRGMYGETNALPF